MNYDLARDLLNLGESSQVADVAARCADIQRRWDERELEWYRGSGLLAIEGQSINWSESDQCKQAYLQTFGVLRGLRDHNASCVTTRRLRETTGCLHATRLYVVIDPEVADAVNAAIRHVTATESDDAAAFVEAVAHRAGADIVIARGRLHFTSRETGVRWVHGTRLTPKDLHRR